MKKPAALMSQAVAKATGAAAPSPSIGPPNGSNILRPGNVDEGHANSAFKKPSSAEVKLKGGSWFATYAHQSFALSRCSYICTRPSSQRGFIA